MRTTFTAEEIMDLTAKDIATFERDYAADPNPSAQRLFQIVRDLHSLASSPERDPSAVAELEARITGFLAEDKRNKAFTPYLHMARSLKESATPNI